MRQAVLAVATDLAWLSALASRESLTTPHYSHDSHHCSQRQPHDCCLSSVFGTMGSPKSILPIRQPLASCQRLDCLPAGFDRWRLLMRALASLLLTLFLRMALPYYGFDVCAVIPYEPFDRIGVTRGCRTVHPTCLPSGLGCLPLSPDRGFRICLCCLCWLAYA